MNKMTSFSFVMAGVNKCQSKCLYCSAGSTMAYEQFRANPCLTPDIIDLKWNEQAIINRFDNHPQFIQEVAQAAFNKVKPTVHVDIWGANPLFNFSAFKKTVNFLLWYFKEGNNRWLIKWNILLHTSDNALSFASTPITEYVIANNIHVQLSHDGLGEWIRTGDVDPLAIGSPCFENIKLCAKLGLIDWINCTLSSLNTSFFGNINYFNKWRQDAEIWEKPLFIKLNHVYPGTYDVKAINTKGLKNGVVHPELIGKPIGDLAIRGKDLWDYMGEFVQLVMMFEDPYYTEGRYYKPYVSYINGQKSRFKILKSHEEKTGACRAYQRYKHSVGDPSSWSSTTFVIDSLGEYSECNLIDSTFSVKNPGGPQPEHCKGCKYEFASECNQCGTENMADECEWLYAFNAMTRAFKFIENRKRTVVSANK